MNEWFDALHQIVEIFQMLVEHVGKGRTVIGFLSSGRQQRDRVAELISLSGGGQERKSARASADLDSY